MDLIKQLIIFNINKSSNWIKINANCEYPSLNIYNAIQLASDCDWGPATYEHFAPNVCRALQ